MINREPYFLLKRSDSQINSHTDQSQTSIKTTKKPKIESLSDSLKLEPTNPNNGSLQQQQQHSKESQVKKQKQKFSGEDLDMDAHHQHASVNKLSSSHPFYTSSKPAENAQFRHSHSVATSDSSDASILQNTSSSNETFSLYNGASIGSGHNYTENHVMASNNHHFNQYGYGQEMHPQSGFYANGSEPSKYYEGAQPGSYDYTSQDPKSEQYFLNSYSHYTGAYVTPQESSHLNYKETGSSSQNSSPTEYNGSSSHYTGTNGSVSFSSMSDSSSTTSRQLNFNPGSSFENNSNHYEPSYDYGGNNNNICNKTESTSLMCTSFLNSTLPMSISSNENCALNSYYHENNSYNVFQ